MKQLVGLPPTSYHVTHKFIPANSPFAARLEIISVPMERYIYAGGPHGYWVEKWIVDLCTEWAHYQSEDWNSEVLKRVISYAYRMNDVDFAQACMAAMRLSGVEAVKQMLTERKDLVR